MACVVLGLLLAVAGGMTRCRIGRPVARLRSHPVEQPSPSSRVQGRGRRRHGLPHPMPQISRCGGAGDQPPAGCLPGARGHAQQHRRLVPLRRSVGALKPITYPLPGNHEYSADIDAYNEYWGDAAHAPLHYYSFDLGSWHVVALNGEADTSAGSAQETWFREDLAAHPAACTVVLIHGPRWSSSRDHPSDPSLQALWGVAVGGHVDLWLSGHNHLYERFVAARCRRPALRRGHHGDGHRHGWPPAASLRPGTPRR